ncbi:MAG: nucleotidyl transferase AbiEii/AbiGii toxin family protein [Polyangiaceae bacterium]
MTLTARQSIEFFHLVFLRALVAKGEEKSLIALKGGCNLRFYFGSIRYSEDMDFDVSVIAKGTLKNKVDRLLKSPIVLSPLNVSTPVV